MIGLDTNVLLRWLIDESIWPEDSPGQMAAAEALIRDRTSTFFVNQVVLAETAWVLLNPMKQPKAVLIELLERLISAANVVVERREAVMAALAGWREGKPGFADHLIGHVNRHAGCETTVSFDKDAERTGLFRRLAPRSEPARKPR